MSKGRAGKIEALREQAKEWQSAYECERADHETTAALTRSRTKPIPNDKMMTPELVPIGSGEAAVSDLLLEAAGEIERLRAALKPFADAVYNDNGDMIITPCGIDEYAKAYFVMRRLEK